jgi:hypothetical protein
MAEGRKRLERGATCSDAAGVGQAQFGIGAVRQQVYAGLAAA